MNTIKNLDKLRRLMAGSDFDAYIIPSTDPHMGEYVPKYWEARTWLSGFTGSAGTLVITKDFAGLWTDSRYFLQAEAELKDSGIELVKLVVPHTPEHVDWLLKKLPKGSVVALDGTVVSIDSVNYIKALLAPKQIDVVTNEDLVSQIWTDRPELPTDLVIDHDVNFAGSSRVNKIAIVRAEMERLKVDHHLIASLDDIAWLLNLRGTDILYNPLFVSYVLISMNTVTLFINPAKVSPSLKTTLEAEGITLNGYTDIAKVLSGIAKGEKLLIATSKVNQAIADAIPSGVKIIEGTNITTALKAIKNGTEITNLRKTMEYDGVALVKFFHWLGNAIGKETITELSAAEKIRQYRSEQPNFMGLSFGSIAGYAGHGAIVHYNPSPETDVELKPEGLFLLDSGGQYLSGTTDVTRTVALSTPNEEEKRDFTLALKGTIDLSDAIFPVGTRGYQLDALARIALWKQGINYGHGTGHGVGFFLNVHEGPQSINPNAAGPAVNVMEVGMVTSVEPAMYREGKHGIRTENLVLCVAGDQTTYGSFLKFETLTLCPIDRTIIDTQLLTADELKWLNDYHAMVYTRLSAYLSGAELEWLKQKTKPLQF